MMHRRTFVQTLVAGAGGVALGPQRAAASDAVQLVILHTNDTHSRIEPFPNDGGRFATLGGVARRATLIKHIRQHHPNVLLLDSGDIFQGTPYFNFFGGEIEFRAMSSMRYDAATLGNHDFDNGVEGLVNMLPHARFEFVTANYDAGDSDLASHIKPYTTRTFQGVKIGIFGLGVDFDGLVLPRMHFPVRYQDPVLAAQRACSELRAEGCHLVVCLSHLGYRYQDDRVSDTLLAKSVPDIDIILGGHTHTFLDRPDVHRHGSRHTVVTQVGFAGIRLGRVDVTFQPNAAPSVRSQSYQIDAGLDYPAG